MPPAPEEPSQYRPLSGRQTAIFTVFGLLIVLDVVAVFSSYLELDLLNSVAAGEEMTEAEANANDLRQGVIGLAQFGAWIAAIVVFIRWLHRAYQNVDALAPAERRHGTGWAIGGWFVPILSLWRPKQIINDVWRASGTPHERDADPPGWLALWWLVFLLNGFLGNLAAKLAVRSDTLDQMRDADKVYMLSDSFDIVAAALALVVVHRLTERMDAAAAASASRFRAPERPLGSPAGAVSE